MSETPVCEICGNENRRHTRAELEAILSGDPVPDLCGNTGGDYCKSRGYERARAALSAAEKERDEARRLKETTEAMWKSCTRQVADERDAAEKREARLIGWLRALQTETISSETWSVEFGAVAISNCPECNGELEKHEAGCALKAAILEASAASAAPAAPKAISESRPLDPPETA